MDVIASLLGLGAIGGVGWSSKDAVAALRRDHERTLSDYLPWRRPIRANVVTTSEDEYLTVFRFSARDVGTQDPAEVFEIARRLAVAIGGLKPKANVKVHFHTISDQTREYLRPAIKPANPVLDAADEERERFFLEDEPGFGTVRFLSLAWKPAAGDLARLRIAAAKNVDAALAIEQKMLVEFESIVARLKSSLDDAFEMVHRLGEYHAADDFGVARKRSELYEFLHYFVIGKFAPFNVPEDSAIELHGLLSSRGFEGRVPIPKIGDDFVLPIVLKTFPQESESGILDELQRIGVPHYFSVRYLPLTLADVHKQTRDIVLDFQGAAKQNGSFVDPGAVDSAEEVADAHGAAKGAYTQFGWCIFTVVVRAKTFGELTAAKNAVLSVLEKSGFPNAYIPEESGWEAIVSTFPGASRWSGIHKHLEHSLGVATLVPLHAHDRGRVFSDHPYRVARTPAHFYAMGRGQALTRVHTSVADVEHMIGLAPSGWGKTTFEAYLGLMRIARLPFSGLGYFDKGLGAYRAAMMADGIVYDPLGPRNSPGLALFDGSLGDDVIIEILSEMVEFWEPYTRPSADEDESLRKALRVVMSPTFPVEYRSMTAFCRQLQDDTGRLRPVLDKYTDGGPLRNLIDASVDSFTTSSTWTVFDIERVIDMPPKYLIPLLRVLFHKIFASASGRRATLGDQGHLYQYHVNLDESHLLQKHPAGEKFILDVLKMGRAQNLGLSLWSNGLAEFAGSRDRGELMFQCRTRIFGVNAAAAGDDESEMLRSLGVNDRGIHDITHPTPDGVRDFVLSQPDAGVQQVLNARLNGPMLAIIGDPRTNYQVDDFRAAWTVEKHGLHEWKCRLIEHEAERHADPAQRVRIAAFAARLRAKVAVQRLHETPGAVMLSA